MRVFVLTLSIALVACNTKQNVGSTNAAPAPAQSAKTAAAPPPAATAPGAERISGKVLETMNSGGYSYVRVATDGGEKWAAVREMKIAKGDNVTIDAQMTMQAFESKSLGRTFDAIAFGVIAGPAPAAAMPSGEAKDHMKAPAAAGDVMVERAAGGKTVGEIWAERTALKDKDVLVRGRVVKSLSGIMGSNWIHIQDGSGSGETRDLTVTTQDTAAVGDIVTVKGTVRADKDFGYGYKYAVIVENARVAKN